MILNGYWVFQTMKTEEQGSQFCFLLYSPFLVICYCWLSSAAIPHLPLFPPIQFYYFKLSWKPLYRVVYCSCDFSCPWGIKLAILQADRQHLRSTYLPFFCLLQQVHSNRIMEWKETFSLNLLPVLNYQMQKGSKTAFTKSTFCLWGKFLWLLLWAPQNKGLTQT